MIKPFSPKKPSKKDKIMFRNSGEQRIGYKNSNMKTYGRLGVLETRSERHSRTHGNILN